MKGSWFAFILVLLILSSVGLTSCVGSQGPQGLQGDKGDIGLQGERGIQGLKGDKGDNGSQGVQGIKGDKGDVGSQGPQGIQGPKGDTGEQGTMGMQGLTGFVGPKGNEGDKGNVGFQGTQGIQGIQGVQGDKGDSVSAAIISIDYYLANGVNPPTPHAKGVPNIGQGDLLLISGAGFIDGETVTLYTDAAKNPYANPPILWIQILITTAGTTGTFGDQTYANWPGVNWPPLGGGVGVKSIKAVGSKGSLAYSIIWLQGR